jgi:flagellin
MTITVNTNMQALSIQNNLKTATDKMNKAMERMSSGSKINTAADDAAGYAVSTKLETSISSSKVASSNVAIGSNLLDTTEGTMDVILSNLQRIRDLATQAANGTYSTDDLAAMEAEADARASEINSLAGNTKFNGIQLFGDQSGAATAGVTLQVGTEGTDTMKIDKSIFGAATITGLGLGTGATIIKDAFATSTAANTFLSKCTTAINNVTTRQTSIGAAQNKLSAAANGLTVQQKNLTAANSTIKDADVSQESAAYVQSQILQSASASLLTQANSAPQIALTLIKG